MDTHDGDTVPADRVKSIREGLGLSQHALATRVGVSRATVARWESGERLCAGARAVELLRAARRALTFGHIDPEDLARLDATDAVALFRDLLWAECWVRGLPTSSVSISLREARDGGIDADVESVPPRARPGLLGAGRSVFQIKTGDAKPWQPGWVQRELETVAGELGEAVRSALEGGASYTLVCFGVDLISKDRRPGAVNALRAILRRHGFPEARVDVLGQQELVGHLRAFPGLCAELAGDGELGFRRHSSWRMDALMDVPLQQDESHAELGARILESMRKDESLHVRLTGEPGVGKTRLVLEALSADDIAPCVLYFESAEAFERSRLFDRLLRPDVRQFSILVLDECPPATAVSIWNVLRPRGDACRVITIGHVPLGRIDDSVEEMACPPLADESVERIIAEYTGSQADAWKWSRLCEGSPRVAHEVGKSLRQEPSGPLRPARMQGVWDRFIAGGHDPESERNTLKSLVLRHIALFLRFGFEPPVADEAGWIADVVARTDPAVTRRKFQSIVKELRDQRILQGGTTLFIAPRLFHIHLWTEFWEHYGQDEGFLSDLMGRVPASMYTWFARMFSYAGGSRVAQRQLTSLLSPSGALGDPSRAFSPFGMQLLLYAAEAAPNETLLCLEAAVSALPAEGHVPHAIRLEAQHTIEKLVALPRLFVRAARLLLRLAAEDSDVCRGGPGQMFAELFCVYPGRAAPTGASPQERHEVLEDALGSPSPEIRRLGIEACKAALALRSPRRSMGREYHGLSRIKMWAPPVWGDVYNALEQVWASLYETSRGWGASLRGEANAALIEATPRLLPIKSLASSVIATLRRLLLDEATDRRELIGMLNRARRFGGDEIGADSRAALDQIDAEITGTSLEEKIRRVVIYGDWDEYYERTEDPEAALGRRAAELAGNVLMAPDQYSKILPSLVSGTNAAITVFGEELGRVDVTGELLPRTLSGYRDADDPPTHYLLAGYLTAVFERSPAEWEIRLEQFGEIPALAPMAGLFLHRSGFTERALLWLLDGVRGGSLGAGCLDSLMYIRGLRGTSDETIESLIDLLLEHEKTRHALEVFDYVYCSKNVTKSLPRDLALRLLRCDAVQEGRQSRADHNWKEIANALLQQESGLEREVLNLLIAKVARGENHDYDGGPLETARSVLRVAPRLAWDCITARLRTLRGAARWRVLEWLGPSRGRGHLRHHALLSQLDLEHVMAWVSEDPESRAPEIAVAVPKTLDPEEGGVFTRTLLDRYGDDDRVRRRLNTQFFTEGWSGPSSEHYRRKRDAARLWQVRESSRRVLAWIDEYIQSLTSLINDSKLREEREPW